jgi:hypothetical protein
MTPTHKLSFVPSEPDLSKTAKSFLEKRFVQEDYKSYWIDIASLFDDLGGCDGNTIFTGVKLPKKFNMNKLTVADIPKEWWKLMAFSPKVEKAIKAFWKKHPEGEVEWKW